MNKKLQVDVSSNEDMLLFVITGHTSTEAAAAAAQAVFKAVNERRPTKVLIDCTKVMGRLSVVDTYFHVREYPFQSYRAKVAVVDNAEHVDYDSFHETTAANVGFYIKFFRDIDEALKWLNQ